MVKVLLVDDTSAERVGNGRNGVVTASGLGRGIEGNMRAGNEGERRCE